MATKIELSISIPKTLFEQAEQVAKQLHLSQSHLFEAALEDFISRHQVSPQPDDGQNGGERIGGEQRRINQGDIYWVQLDNPNALKAGIAHPHVVIQDNLFNHSRIHTVVACALTSNLNRISNTPGNILLEAGEANLPRQSVVEVSKISTVDKQALGEYIGSLSEQRIQQILAGMRFLHRSTFAR